MATTAARRPFDEWTIKEHHRQCLLPTRERSLPNLSRAAQTGRTGTNRDRLSPQPTTDGGPPTRETAASRQGQRPFIPSSRSAGQQPIGHSRFYRSAPIPHCPSSQGAPLKCTDGKPKGCGNERTESNNKSHLAVCLYSFTNLVQDHLPCALIRWPDLVSMISHVHYYL